MKQTIMKKYAALFATFCLCAALVPCLAFAVEEEYQAGSLADGTEVTTQAGETQYSVTVYAEINKDIVGKSSELELTVGYEANKDCMLAASVVGGTTGFNTGYQWYSTTSNAVPSDPTSGSPIVGATDTTYIPANLQVGTYYYYCVAKLTKEGETEIQANPTNVVTVTVKEKEQVMPSNVEAVNETLKGSKDGAIVNVTKDMEWRLQSDTSGKWNDCAKNPDATTIEGLSPGTYEVRLKAVGDLKASEPVVLPIKYDADLKIEIGSNAPKVDVPNLGDFALSVKASSDTDEDTPVTINLDVHAIASNSNNEDVNKIKAAAKDKTLTCFGLDLSKTVGSNAAEPLTNLENDVLEINVEYTTKDRKNIVAYRVHGDKAEAFKSLSKKPTSDFTDGTYYVGDGTVTIYSSKFSTYALGYDTKANDANQQQNTTPATGDTLPGVVPFAIVAAIAIIAMVVARRFIRKTW